MHQENSGNPEWDQFVVETDGWEYSTAVGLRPVAATRLWD
jgi:hypothetical protein